LPWLEVASRIRFEVGVIPAKPVLTNVIGTWLEIWNHDAGVVAVLAADNFSPSEGIDSAEAGKKSQFTVDPSRL
jgi:hypothetical protein